MLKRFIVALLVVLPLLVGASGVTAQTRISRHSRYVMVYGYITDRHPESDSTLDLWSKPHKTTYHVAILSSTVIKFHTTVVPRSRLSYNTYVIASCIRGSGGTLEAVTIHIETPRHKKH